MKPPGRCELTPMPARPWTLEARKVGHLGSGLTEANLFRPSNGAEMKD